MLRRLFPAFICVLIGALCSVGGWWLGFRDGATRAYADTGLILSRYHLALHTGKPEEAVLALDALTAQTAIHLLNGRHHWPLVMENPYRAENALSELRATWTPGARAFFLASGTAIHYPYESNNSSSSEEQLYNAIPPARAR